MTFSEKARKVHGDKYDYTNTVYISSRKSITYLCPLHGEVTQLAKSHLAGKGCRQCGYITRSKKQTSTTEEFIEKARQVHGERYGYSLTRYTKAKEHVEIVCRTCGHCFRQTPDDHLRGKGCAKCAGNHKRTQEDFVEDSRKIHGERYEYGRYTGRDNYLEILCRNCGQTFEITANNHLNGYGCKVCYPGFVDPCRMSEEERGAKLGEFISEVSELYQGKYDYSEFDYITSRTPSTIICPEHGRFLKTPYLHRKGYGCPVCASSISKGQKYWIEFFRQYGEVLVDTYPFGEKKQIDIYLPELRLAVEYNGIPGHHSSSTGIEFFDRGTKHTEYHKEKYELCKKHGITLIHIFEFENTKKWERRLREYLKEPDRFQIGYSNEKRTILRSKIKLTYYGKTIMKKMFNEEADYNDSSLLFGKDVGLFDTVNRHHPRLWDLYKEAVSFNWSETEFTFNECLKEFARKDDVAEIMINTLAYQWEADSVVAHTLLPLLAPFITNTELQQCMAFNTYMEGVHAATYSEIVRNSFKDPTKVIEDIVARKEAVERLEPCGKVLQELHDMGHRYALGQATLEEAFPVVYRGLVALYCLERIGFIASFAITFAIGEAGLYLPISQAVRKICADEIQIHAEVDLYVLRELKKDSKFTQFFTPELEKDVEAIVDEVAKAEAEWTDYLFDGKSLVGVNANLIKDWVTFNVQIVKHELRLPYEKKIKQNPLPWITQWMSQNNLQASPMEQDIGQYKIGGISDDIGDMEIDMDF